MTVYAAFRKRYDGVDLFLGVGTPDAARGLWSRPWLLHSQEHWSHEPKIHTVISAPSACRSNT